MHPPATPAALLFAYAFLSNVARRFPFATIALSGLTPVLLAWLGTAVRLPLGVMVALFVLLMVPSLRMIRWPRAAS